MNELQARVDALSARSKPLAVDDSQFRLVVCSVHDGVIDSVRLAKLLHREANAEVRSWIEACDVRANRSFVRVPANPELDMAERIIVPLRFDDSLVDSCR